MSWIMSFLRNLFRPWIGHPLPPQTSLEPSPSEPVAKRLVLEELRDVLTHQFEAGDALDSKLKELLSAASLILSIVTTLQITTGVGHIGWFYWCTLVLALVLYVALILVTLRGLQPIEYHSPVPANWDEIEERFFDLGEAAALDLLIVNYLEYSAMNNGPLKNKVRKVQQASRLLALIVILLVVMGLFGLSGSVTFPWQSPLPTPIP
jgi:hypothetical protein